MLTPEEKTAAKTARIPSFRNCEGVRVATWGKPLVGYWPSAKVAQLRGTQFHPVHIPGTQLTVYGPDSNSYYIAGKALKDTAKWLGFPDVITYNNTCANNPKEVLRRLRNVK